MLQLMLARIFSQSFALQHSLKKFFGNVPQLSLHFFNGQFGNSREASGKGLKT